MNFKARFLIIIGIAFAILFTISVKAMEFDPGSGSFSEGATHTIDILFDRPVTDNYTAVNVNLDVTNMTVLGVTPGSFQIVNGCSNQQSYTSTRVCFTAATNTGAFSDGNLVASINVRFGTPGTATIIGNGSDPLNINGYYRTYPAPTFMEQTGTLATYTVIGVIPRTALEINPGVLLTAAGILLIFTGILFRKYIQNKKSELTPKKFFPS